MSKSTTTFTVWWFFVLSSSAYSLCLQASAKRVIHCTGEGCLKYAAASVILRHLKNYSLFMPPKSFKSLSLSLLKGTSGQNSLVRRFEQNESDVKMNFPNLAQNEHRGACHQVHSSYVKKDFAIANGRSRPVCTSNLLICCKGNYSYEISEGVKRKTIADQMKSCFWSGRVAALVIMTCWMPWV